MSAKPRRLYSVPTGPDVAPGTGRDVPVDPASDVVQEPGHPPGPWAADSPDSESEAAHPARPATADLIAQAPTDTQALMERIGQSSEAEDRGSAPDGSARRPRPAEPVTLRVYASIEGISPPIWRRLDLASDLTLDQLHIVLQTAFGWEDSHLHSFTSGADRYSREAEQYLTSFDVAEGEHHGVGEAEVQLGELLVDAGDKISYTYDFGDDWEHTLLLESLWPRVDGDPVADLLDGRRAGPPEDCGGVWGYRDLMEQGAMPGGAEHFDVAGISAALARFDSLVGESPGRYGSPAPLVLVSDLPAALAELRSRSSAGSILPGLLSDIDFAGPIALQPADQAGLVARYSWLLRRVGVDGLTLTSAGYLRPVDVRAAFAEIDFGEQWYGAGNREVHVRPLLMLRESAQLMGLLRKAKGRLSLTKAALALTDDPAALVDWIASRLPLGKRPAEKDAGLALLTVLAAGGIRQTRPIDDLVADVLAGVGWRDTDGRPVTGELAHRAAKPTSTVLVQLGAMVWLPHFTDRTVTPEGVEFARQALLRTAGSRG